MRTCVEVRNKVLPLLQYILSTGHSCSSGRVRQSSEAPQLRPDGRVAAHPLLGSRARPPRTGMARFAAYLHAAVVIVSRGALFFPLVFDIAGHLFEVEGGRSSSVLCMWRSARNVRAIWSVNRKSARYCAMAAASTTRSSGDATSMWSSTSSHVTRRAAADGSGSELELCVRGARPSAVFGACVGSNRPQSWACPPPRPACPPPPAPAALPFVSSL